MVMNQHRRARFVQQFTGEAVVSRTVEKFAKDQNLLWQSYHHDEAIWYISHQEKTGQSTTIRIVQVAALYGDLDLPNTEYYALWAIPFAQEIDEASMEGWVLEQVPQPPPPIPGNKIEESSVYNLLRQAWDIARKIKREEIRKGASTPLPFKPTRWPPS